MKISIGVVAGIVLLNVNCQAAVQDVLRAEFAAEDPVLCASSTAIFEAVGAQLATQAGDQLANVSGPQFCSEVAAVAANDNKVKHQIEDLYRTILGREADPEGLAWWLKQVELGKTVDFVRKDFEWCHALPKDDKNHCD